MLPILSPKRSNIEQFLNGAVLFPPQHSISKEAFELLVEYQEIALKHWSDKAQKPYGFSQQELQQTKSDVYLLEGEQDILFPYAKSVLNAKQGISGLKDVVVLPQTGHGIELSPIALKQLLAWLKG